METDNPIEYERNEFHSIEKEAAVLGALMSDTRLHEIVFLKLHEDIFIKEEHKRVFAACSSMYKNGRPIDSGTVIEQLKATGDLDLAGGADYVLTLTNRAASSSKLEYYSHIVELYFLKLHYLHRKLVRVFMENSKRPDESKTDSR